MSQRPCIMVKSQPCLLSIDIIASSGSMLKAWLASAKIKNWCLLGSCSNLAQGLAGKSKEFWDTWLARAKNSGIMLKPCSRPGWQEQRTGAFWDHAQTLLKAWLARAKNSGIMLKPCSRPGWQEQRTGVFWDHAQTLLKHREILGSCAFVQAQRDLMPPLEGSNPSWKVVHDRWKIVQAQRFWDHAQTLAGRLFQYRAF